MSLIVIGFKCQRSALRAENPRLWVFCFDRGLEFEWDLCHVRYVKQINDFFKDLRFKLMLLYTSQCCIVLHR